MKLRKTNIDLKQEGKRITVLSPSLNNTNLRRRPVCLESILVFSFPKIQYHFSLNYFSQIFPFSGVFSSKKNFSARAEFFSASETELNFFSLLFSAAEFLKRELKMQLYSINGGLAPQNSAEFQLKNKKFSCDLKNSAGTYNKRKDFALNFIQNNRISLENFSSHPLFPGLTKNEKDSIRYYLKKESPKKIIETSKKSRGVEKQKKKQSTKGLSLLLIPIGAVEAAICLLSAKFYLSLGLSPILAYTLALAVESFYMASSAMSNFKFQILRLLILGYSIFTVAYSNLTTDSNLIKERETVAYQITQKEQELASLGGSLKSLNLEKSVFLNSLEAYNKEKYISRGIKNVTPELKRIDAKKVPLEQKVFQARKDLELLKQKQLRASSFTLNTFTKLQISTIAIIIGFMIVQLCTSLFLPSSLSALKKTTRRFSLKLKSYQRVRYAHRLRHNPIHLTFLN